jgi:hypothetical protein
MNMKTMTSCGEPSLSVDMMLLTPMKDLIFVMGLNIRNMRKGRRVALGMLKKFPTYSRIVAIKQAKSNLWKPEFRR